VSAISALLTDVDRVWRPTRTGKTALHVIGASALLLQSDYGRATKDSDVLETAALDDDVKARLLALAGADSSLALKHRLYIETVPLGLPFLPQKPLWHARPEINAQLQHFEVCVLDVVDVVVSKLLRFSANDSADVHAMIARDLVPHERALARFRSALDQLSYDARNHRLQRCIDSFNEIERDAFAVAETEFDLPSWVDED
jgi:hypothetical protein